MSDFLDRLITFVNENAGTKDLYTLYFEYANCKINYFSAWDIVEELRTYKMHIEKFVEETDELKDYIRLLRKENKELTHQHEDKGE